MESTGEKNKVDLKDDEPTNEVGRAQPKRRQGDPIRPSVHR